MRFWVGITDNDWYRFLAARRPDEVNFWQPSVGHAFKAVLPGAPFLFKLHHPDNFVVGGGYFTRYSALPLSFAWDAFLENNGAADFESCYRRVSKYRRGYPEPDPVIGCIVLSQPFFFMREDWIPIPADWKPNIVQGKTYDTVTEEGAALWTAVEERLGSPILPVAVAEDRYGQEYLTQGRLGQGGFRVLVADAYSRRCAITGEKTLPVLEAAHIRPFAQDGPHRVDNGLLLKSDLHILFDKGYLTVTPDYHVEVSPRIKIKFGNGRDYYLLHGKELRVLPNEAAERPAREYLLWHNNRVFSP